MPDYSMPDEDDLYEAPAKAAKSKPKRKKRGLKKKDKEALGLSTGRRTTRGPQPAAQPAAKPRSLFFVLDVVACVPPLNEVLQVGHPARCRTELPAQRSEANGCLRAGISL